MIDVAVVGGGLSGLALAVQLQGRGQNCRLFEARSRLGGRIHSIVSPRSGANVDLGPAWIWPDSQPLIVKLLADLGLATFPQYEDGAVLYLRDPDKRVEAEQNDGLRGGARRVEGGVSRLIEALGDRLLPDTASVGHVLTSLCDRGDWIDLEFRTGDSRTRLSARRVVLAMPPRLAQEHVAFTPDLPEDTVQAMREAPTWMASAAKVVVGYETPRWRERGWSGDAFVSHQQAVIGEIFDSCDGAGGAAALGGFVALSPFNRDAFRLGLPMLIANQLGQVFGPEFEGGDQIYHDWSKQRWTCSTLDLVEPATEPELAANPLLRRPFWGGKLFLGGSETAASEAGYLEGALSAAARIDGIFKMEQAMSGEPEMREIANDEGGVSTANMASLAQFAIWVGEHQDSAFDRYRELLSCRLAAQDRDQLTQRALLEAVEQTFEQALEFMGDLPFDMDGVPIERGRSALMPLIQAPFADFLRDLMDDVTAFNRTSCALSNFPDEHRISKLYRETMLRDVAAAWKDFCLAANSILLSKAGLGAAEPDARRAGQAKQQV